jgi:hypothetical protein
MSQATIPRLLRSNERYTMLVSHLLVLAMAMCVVALFIQFGQRLVPGWSAGYLYVVTFLVALEAMYSRRTLYRVMPLSITWFRHRVAEWVVILVALKALLYLLRGTEQFWIDVQLWPQAFFVNFFSGEFLGAAAISWVAWSITGMFTGVLLDLEGDALFADDDSRAVLLSDRPGARQRLAERFFLVGGLMIFMIALLRLDLGALDLNLPIVRTGVGWLVVYLLLGLALLGLSNFAVLRARWGWDRIPLARNLAGQWALYTLLFVAGVALVAVLLPTSYSVGLLEVLGYVILMIVEVMRYLLLLAAIPILLFIMLVMSLLGVGQSDINLPELEFAPPPLPGGGELSWLALLRSVLFWVVILGVVFFAFRHYLRQRQDLLARLRRLPGIAQALAAWHWLHGRLTRANRRLRAAWQASRQRLRPTADPAPATSWRFTNPGRLSARERVLFFYLAMVRRGTESGIHRQPDQTPYEYAQSLEAALPENFEDVATLTDSFVEARYSRHDISSEQAGTVQTLWERIKRALRRR